MFLSTVKRDEFLPPLGGWTTFGGMLLVTTFGAGIALAALTPYNVAVKAAATVLPTGETRLVQSATTATIKQILVQAGQSVRRGEAIALLDKAPLQTQKNQLSGSISSVQQQLRQLKVQLQAIDQRITSETTLANQAIGAAQAKLDLTQRDYQDRKVTAQTLVQEAEATLELARTEMQQYRALTQSGSVSKLQMQEKVEAFKVAQARLAQAQALLNPSEASVTIASTQIAQNRSQAASTVALLAQDRAHLVQQQLDLQNRLNRDRRELQQLQHDLALSALTATADGTLLKSTLRNPGQVVQIGETIAQITPSSIPLTIKARISAQDIAQVKVCPTATFATCPIGQVYLRISAYPYPDYGTLKGVVREITADVLPQSNPDQPQYYEVTIQPEQSYLERKGQRYPIQPGMEAIAEIIAQRETVLMFMLRQAKLLI